MPIDGRIVNQVRFIVDPAGRIVGYRNPITDEDEFSLNLTQSGDTFELSTGNDSVLLSGAQLESVQAIADTDYATHEPVRGSALATSIQFRGAADTTASLGTIGLVVNASSDSAAGTRLAGSDADWASDINGAATAGRTRVVGPWASAVTRVHVAQLGLTAPLTDNASGPVLAASNQMTELTFDAALDVRALLVVEGGPTNFAGESGTGSARNVTIYGLAEVAA